jgi:beta-galactosidase
VGHLLAGAKHHARVAIIHDYASRWSVDWQRHHSDFSYVEHLVSYYKPVAARNIAVDIIPPDAPLDGYKMVIVPALLMAGADFAEKLKRFAKRSGHIILTLRTGVKDDENALLPMRPPGYLAELAGVEVEEYYALEQPIPVKGNWFSGEARLWAERIKVTGKTSAVAARFGYSNGWLDEQPAVVVNAHGTGMVYYIAGWLNDAAQDMVLERFLRTASVKPPVETPAGVEVTRRTDAAGQDVYLFINHTTAEQAVNLSFASMEHLTGEQREPGPFSLDPYGVAVMTKYTPPPAEEPALAEEQLTVEGLLQTEEQVASQEPLPAE